MERDWLRVASDDGRVWLAALLLNRREDSLSVVKHIFIRLLEGGDVSPKTREFLLGRIECGEVRFASDAQSGPGKKSSPLRDIWIERCFHGNLERMGGKEEAACQATADTFKITPSAIRKAIARNNKRRTELGIKSE